jgi:SRSO17 transposase
MKDSERAFDRYLDDRCVALGHIDRREGLKGCCRGVMWQKERKSVEPLAAHFAPRHLRAVHQSLHHFVAKPHSNSINSGNSAHRKPPV